MQQACTAADAPPTAADALPTAADAPPTTPPHASSSALSLQQSRQVLGVLEEAFSAVMYHLQQVSPGDPGRVQVESR